MDSIAHAESRREKVQRYHRRDEILGKEVIDSDARRIGLVRDLAYSLDGRLAFVVEKGGQEAFLPFERIEKIGDIIFVGSEGVLEMIPITEKTCPNCKDANPANSKFCQKCGVTLP